MYSTNHHREYFFLDSYSVLNVQTHLTRRSYNLLSILSRNGRASVRVQPRLRSNHTTIN